MSGYEPDSISIPALRNVAITVIGVLVVVGALLVAWRFEYVPAAQMDTHVADDYAAYVKQSQVRLSSSGPDHMSIDQAMDTIVREGVK